MSTYHESLKLRKFDSKVRSNEDVHYGHGNRI